MPSPTAALPLWGLLILLPWLLLPATRVCGQALGTPAPLFTAETLAGETVRLEDLQGQVVLLDFWASWCGPCQQELPFLASVHAAYQDQPFTILAVNVDEGAADRDAFLADLEAALPFTILSDPEALLPPRYQLAAMPTSFLIDADGVIRYRHNGFRPSDAPLFHAEIQRLLAEHAAEAGQ